MAAVAVPAPAEVQRPAEASGEPARAAMVHPSVTDAAIIGRWQSVARAAAELGPVLRGIVSNCTLLRAAGGKVVLDCPDRLRTAALKQAAKLGELFSREMGAAVVVEIYDPEAAKEAAEAEGGDALEAGESSAPATVPTPARPDPVMATEHPLVKQALELFQARVVDVQPRRG